MASQSIALWDQRQQLRLVPALILAIFATVMVVVNSWITAMGMGVVSLNPQRAA